MSNGTIVDNITNFLIVNLGANIINIAYIFKRYYFLLVDSDGSNITSGIKITVNTV